MYNIGMCKICKQGLLEIVKDKKKGKVYICCDECEAEWENPMEAVQGNGGTRGKYGVITYPSLEEIDLQKWEICIFEHHN